MFAIIKTGGKQYKIETGDVLSVEKIPAQPGQRVLFNQVLLIADDNETQIGTPFLEKAAVRALVLENFKDEKVLVFKKKRRKQYRRTRGHRQQLTKVRITRITMDRTRITAEDLAEEKLAPIEKPAPAPKPKAVAPAPVAEKPAKAAAKAKPAKKPAAKPKAEKKPATTKKTK